MQRSGGFQSGWELHIFVSSVQWSKNKNRIDISFYGSDEVQNLNGKGKPLKKKKKSKDILIQMLEDI